VKYFEDLEVGETTRFGRYEVTREEIIEYARQFDPQPFHLDEEAARRAEERLLDLLLPPAPPAPMPTSPAAGAPAAPPPPAGDQAKTLFLVSAEGEVTQKEESEDAKAQGRRERGGVATVTDPPLQSGALPHFVTVGNRKPPEKIDIRLERHRTKGRLSSHLRVTRSYLHAREE